MDRPPMTPIDELEQQGRSRSRRESSTSISTAVGVDHRQSTSTSSILDHDRDHDHDHDHDGDITAVNISAEAPVACKSEYMPELGFVLDETEDKEECAGSSATNERLEKNDIDLDAHGNKEEDTLGDLGARQPPRRRAASMSVVGRGSGNESATSYTNTFAALPSSTSSTRYSAGETLARLPTIKNTTYSSGVGLSRISSTRHTELEADLRRHISVHGKVKVGEGVVEDRVRVDLGTGKGAEEVVLVDWIEGDPEVSRLALPIIA